MPRRHSRIDIQSIFRLTELADYIVPFTIRVACDLRLADHLAEGPRTVQELAEATQTHAPSLLRALRALACKGIFTEVEPECFGLTPLAELLRSDHPFSLQGCFPLMPPDIHAWARSDYSVRTGKPAFDHVHGRSYYEYFADHPRDSARFDRSAASVNPLVLATVLPAYDWGSFSTVVDVGGGDGSFLAGILSRHPSMQGVLFDQPLAVANAKSIVVEAGVADRCELRSGDFFDCVPAGKDAYILKTTLHDWDDERAAAILRVVRTAMRPDSRLLIIESLIESGDHFDVGKIMDIKSLVLFGGHVRTQEQFAQLLAGAGLELSRVVRTLMTPIVEACPR